MANASEKVALVTGASGGIGDAIARRLARDGFAVVASGSGSLAKAEELVKSIVAEGGRAIAVRADLSKPSGAADLFTAALGSFHRIDVVVHSAGIMPLTAITPESLETFDRVITVNLRGTYLVLAHAAKRVESGGRIIALSSSVLAKSFPTYGPYIASKAGVEGLVRVLANELRGRNVSVNAVAPGPVATPLFLEGKTEAQIEEFRKLAPLERLGEADDIADVVAFLAGPDGGWVNGQVLRANGGFA